MHRELWCDLKEEKTCFKKCFKASGCKETDDDCKKNCRTKGCCYKDNADIPREGPKYVDDSDDSRDGGGDDSDNSDNGSGNINFDQEHYNELHGDEDHMEKYHPEEETFEMLLKTYKDSPTLFKSAVNKIYFQNEATEYPRYSEQAREPGFVASVPTIPEAEQEEFKAKYLNRTKSCPDFRRVQDIQMPRWNWANENLDILVNQLRLSGFPDDKITNMFNGLPMWVQDENLFNELRRDLSLLALKLEEENNWSNVGIVFAGSSANGFSQNPCKGLPDIPTWITSYESSDVDISIHADGVLEYVAQFDGTRYFPTTIDEFTTSVRTPIWPSDAPKFGDGMVAFYDKWTELIPAGLQFTAYEGHNFLPPWEIRAVYGRRREMSYGEEM